MFQFTPYSLLLLAGFIVSLWLTIAAWSRRPGKGIVPFVVLTVGLMFWSSGALGRLLITTLEGKHLFNQLLYLGVTVVPVAWLFYVLDYTGHDKYVTKRNALLFAIHPILVQFLLITNPLHNQFWNAESLQIIDNLVIYRVVDGGLFWAHAIYSYVILLISCVILLRTMSRSPELFRGQVVSLLIALFAPWIANVVYIAKLSPLPQYVDLTPLAFIVTASLIAYNMYRFRFMDVVPIARDVIVDSMNDAMVVLDMTHRIVDANRSAAQLIDHPMKDIIGKSLFDLLPHRRELLNQYVDVENTVTEIELVNDSKAHFFELKISSIYNRQGEPSARVIILHDITTMKEANIALQAANEQAQEMTRLKSQFLATMSHELRTPLNAIIGYTELQLEGMVGELSEAQQKYQGRILSNAEHLLALINDVLDLSKIEAGRMDLIKKPFVLRDWAQEVVQQNNILADEKGLTFISEIDSKLPETIVGDAGRLKQIVINLLSNAFKFTSEGHVKLTIKQQGTDEMAIIVEDTGIGIPSHKLETIFDEFRQIDNSSTRQYSGTGLGLAIVRKLTLSMGGIVRVNSTVDEGSRFTVMLPIETQPKPKVEIVA